DDRGRDRHAARPPRPRDASGPATGRLADPALVEIGFGVNYVAVIVAAVAAVIIGILYYGVAGFGDRLARLNGTAPRTGPPSPTQFAIGILVVLLNAWGVALLALNLGGGSI